MSTIEPRQRTLRCAIYIRKSTDQNLERDFNSLESQHEVCCAYVTSQRHKGWTELPTIYQDVASLRNWPFERRPAPRRNWTQVQVQESETGATFVARSQVVAERDDAQAIHSTLYTLRWTRDADGWQLSGYQSVRMPALPDILPVESGDLTLRAMVYRPQGNGPFPVVVYAHGNEPDPTGLFESVGPAIAARGYYVIGVHRRGSGLSAEQAPNLLAQLTELQRSGGDVARARFAIAQLEGPQLDDRAAAITIAASHPEINRERIFVIGNSFGGVLAMLAAERGLGLKGAADFAGSAMNWEGSALFRQRMREAASNAHSCLPWPSSERFQHSANQRTGRLGQALQSKNFSGLWHRPGRRTRLRHPRGGFLVRESHGISRSTVPRTMTCSPVSISS